MSCIVVAGTGKSSFVVFPALSYRYFCSLISASLVSPPSFLSRLTPYLAGSAPIVVYSQFQPVLAQTLSGMRSRPEYLAPSLTESFMRRYQVLPGRTHPTMSTSGTGGYLLHTLRV